jgi:GH18 family chitinase
MRLILTVMMIAGILMITAGCSQNSIPTEETANHSPSAGSAIAVNNQPLSAIASGGKVIAAYFFILDDAYSAAISVQDKIPWKRVNRVYIAFATVHDGVLVDYPAGSSDDAVTQREANANKVRNVVSLVRRGNPDAEIFISSNFGGDMDDQYLQAAQDPQKFADSVVDYLKTYDLDGYDMDWESHQIDDYAPQLTSLLSTCHTTFAAAGNNPHGRPYQLTHTVWPGVESAETVAGLTGSVDQLNLMTYGAGDSYDLPTYANAYYDAGVPYTMMVGGLESEAGYPESDGPDTQASVTAKCSYVKDKNLAGLFEWRMDNDMRPDGGLPTFEVTGWMSDCLER